jgi:hypothetical protein
LYLKGYGVYQDSPIKATAEDSTSQTAYSVQELNIEQQYQRDAAACESLANKIVAIEKDPRTKLTSVAFVANKSDKAMMAFLSIDIGDMVKITESTLGLADYYYVNGINFNVTGGNVIAYEWILADVEPDYSDITVEIGNNAFVRVFYPKVPQLINLEEVTIIFSVTAEAITSSTTQYFITLSDGQTNGWSVYRIMDGTGNNRKLGCHMDYSGGGGSWITDGTLTSSTEYRIAICLKRDLSAATIYVDGSAVASSEDVAPVGKPYNQSEMCLYIGEVLGNGENFSLKKCVIYPTTLTAAEVAADAASPCSISGAVFRGPSVLTSELAAYDNTALTVSTKVFDSVYGRVGTPSGTVTSQLIP